VIIPNFPEALAALHHHWHNAAAHPGSGPGRQHPMGTPGAGLEFLTFHRDFVQQVFAWMATQSFPSPLDVAAWTAIPPELRNPSVGWSPVLSQQEIHITTNNPPFASADDLGTFIEVGIHSWIHGATALAFNEPVVGTLHSPESTYFYKIHGLVDYWWQQWQRAHKSVIKDIADNKLIIKEHKELIKEHKEHKELIKEHKELIKEHKELIKEGTKEFKEKDKDIFEGGGHIPIGDPAFGLDDLSTRVSRLEEQAQGRSFIQPAERPDVGGQALSAAGPQPAGVAGAAGIAGFPEPFDPDLEQERREANQQATGQGPSGSDEQGKAGRPERGRRGRGR
jgi:hypothetical protein